MFDTIVKTWKISLESRKSIMEIFENANIVR